MASFASDVFDTGPIMHVTSSASLRFVSISLTSGEQVDSLRALENPPYSWKRHSTDELITLLRT